MQLKRTSRMLAGVAILGVVSTILAGCSGSPASTADGGSLTIPSKDPKATVRVLSILDPKVDNIQPVIDAFEKAHPTITLKWQTVPFDSLNSTLDSHIANKGGDPDVYWADQPRIAALASRGEATDLTSVFSQYKSSFDPTPYSSGIYEGKLWALPIANSTQLLYYNKDLLKKAGIPFPSADVNSRMTWEDLATEAKKAKDAGATYGFTFGQFDRYYQLEALPVSLGGSIGASGKGNLTPDFTSEAWVKAFDWYGSIFKDGTAPKGVTPEQTDPSFVAGKTAFGVQGPWMLPELQASTINWGVAPQPMFAGGKAVTADGSWSLALNPFSKEKQAAAIFMKWMAIDESGGYIKYRSNPELAANVEGKKIYFEKDVFKSAEGQNAAKIIDYETANTGVNRVSTIGYIEFESILNQAFADIRNGADAKTTLEKAKGDLTTAWNKYK
ncbi:sugar ABC transporter substrate-binding protein [Glaciihabitans sp. UYNi722]|uniref:ABC transporter substrate-binding protein n=1 Tax=Glaciihabitans sp. UYNi722 TaxID=3156344 RepID=UPI003395E46A